MSATKSASVFPNRNKKIISNYSCLVVIFRKKEVILLARKTICKKWFGDSLLNSACSNLHGDSLPFIFFKWKGPKEIWLWMFMQEAAKGSHT